MTEGFADPIAGGGIFVIPVMQSPDFSIVNQTGWAIFANGDAYFFSIVASGTVTATAFIGNDFDINAEGAFFYSGTPGAGTLSFSLAPQAGTDQYGNAYQQGIVAYDPGTPATYVQMTAGSVTFNQNGVPVAAVIGSNSSAELLLSSGQTASNTVESILQLLPGVSGGQAALVTLTGALLIPSLNAGVTVATSGSGPQLFGTPDGQLDAAGPDGNTYAIGKARAKTTGTQNIGSTTQAVITGLTLDVAPGDYVFEAWVYFTAAAAANEAFISIGGSATVSAFNSYTDYIATNEPFVITNQPTFGINAGLNTGTLNTGRTWRAHIKGNATVSAAGTITVNGAANTSGSGTIYTTLAGSIFELEPDAS